MAVDPRDPLSSQALRSVFRLVDEMPTESAGPAQEPSSPFQVEPDPPSAPLVGSARYGVKSILGTGGMGEVRLCRDVRVGRDVAVKLALPNVRNDGHARARFVREARIQGQLEHPTIVPVHDLEILPDGAVYFTMKRVRGETLAKLMRSGEGERPTRRKLLSALATVCLGVEFAHQRGVVHRDLKPGNVMLGDFGEAYVLDWGLAKVVGRDDLDSGTDRAADFDDDEMSDGGVHTLDGAVLGTPGYMAPEQLDPALGPITARTDVYALGAILFEILTGRPVVEARGRKDLVEQTLRGVEARTSVRSPDADVAPQLEAICVRALARDPAARFPSARALHDAIDAFLEGAQDLERRRADAARHADAAQVALAGDDDEAARAAAMHEIGRALALDPDNALAKRTMLHLLTVPPRTTPREVVERMHAKDATNIRHGAQLNLPIMASWLLFAPLSYLMGVRDPATFAVGALLLALSAAITYVVSRQANPSSVLQIGSFVLTCGGYVVVSRVLGAFVLAPTLIATYAVVLQAHPRARERTAALVVSCIALVLPTVLETIGVLAPSYSFVDGRMIVEPRLLELEEGPVTLLMVVAGLASLMAPALYVRRIRVALTEAEQQLHVQAWQLEQLVARTP